MRAMLEAVLWISALGLILHTAMSLMGDLRASVVTSRAAWAPLGPQPPEPEPSATAAAMLTLSRRSPFAFGLDDRKSPEVAEEIQRDTSHVEPHQVPPMILAGVTRGSEWRALLEGVPGVSGALAVEVGDSVAGMRVQLIEWDTAVLVAADTALVLQMNSQWR